MDGAFSVDAKGERTHESSYAKVAPEFNTDNFFNYRVTAYKESEKDDWTLPTYSCGSNGVKFCVQNCDKAKTTNSASTSTTNGTTYNQTQQQKANNVAAVDAQKRQQAADAQRIQQDMQRQNQEAANRNAEAQRQQLLLKQQQNAQKQQQLQQGLNQVSAATVDLITALSSRKRAKKEALSYEDGQALLSIVNAENPLNYVQNVIDIFSDLGYTLASQKIMDNGTVFISMNDNGGFVSYPLSIFISRAGSASYDYKNTISFDYQRKTKLIKQLAVISNNLEGLKITGISPSRKVAEEQKQVAIDERKTIESTNTLTDARNFETYCDFLAMEVEHLNFKLDSVSGYNLSTQGKYIRLYYKNLTVAIIHSFYTLKAVNMPDHVDHYKMNKLIAITADNDVAEQALENSDLHKLLVANSEHYFKQGGKFYYPLYQLEKNEVFSNIYVKGYLSPNYKGIKYYMARAELSARATLAKSDKTAVNLRQKGDLYSTGRGILRDKPKALSFYMRASEMGDSVSMCNIASVYMFDGDGIQEDDAKAMEWAQKSIDHGYMDAYATLGIIYQYGKGVKSDPKKARELYELGASKSSPACMRSLSDLYKNGNGVPKDKAKAIEWMEKACAIGKERDQEFYCTYLKDLLKE